MARKAKDAGGVANVHGHATLFHLGVAQRHKPLGRSRPASTGIHDEIGIQLFLALLPAPIAQGHPGDAARVRCGKQSRDLAGIEHTYIAASSKEIPYILLKERAALAID